MVERKDTNGKKRDLKPSPLGGNDEIGCHYKIWPSKKKKKPLHGHVTVRKKVEGGESVYGGHQNLRREENGASLKCEGKRPPP